MKTIILILTLFFFIYAEPCQDYTCDSLAVLAILAANGIDSTDTINFERIIDIDSTTGRITDLDLDMQRLFYRYSVTKRFTTLPDAIGNLTELDALHLKGHMITSLPDTMANLTKMIWLDVRQNRITEFPEFIGSFQNFMAILFSENRLTSIPDTIRNLKKVDVIDLAENQITRLPDDIGEMTFVFNLNIAYNLIDSLPESVGNMLRLISLNAEFNPRLKYIPPSIGNLDSLEELYFADSPLGSIPDEITNLVNLTDLGIAQCGLHNLPDSIVKLTKLTYLNLHNNFLCNLSTPLQNWADTYAWKGWYDTLTWRMTQDCSSPGAENFVKEVSGLFKIHAYPNPFNAYTWIFYNNGSLNNGTVRIFNINGKLIYSRNVSGTGAFKYDASGFGSGFYILKAMFDDKIYTKKIIVQR